MANSSSKKKVGGLKQRCRELEQSLAQREAELEAALEAEARFLRGLAHELRTPLGSILMLAELVAENEAAAIGDREREKVRKIHRAGGDLRQVLDQVSTLAKARSGRLRPVVGRVELRRVIGELAAEFRPAAENGELELLVEWQTGLPETVETDEFLLRQILHQLLRTAFAVTREGRVGLSVLYGDESPAARADVELGERLAVAVSDTGRGVSDEEHKTLFEAFPPGNPRSHRPYGATPLALPLARALAELIDARLVLRSVLGRGSTFTLFLPI